MADAKPISAHAAGVTWSRWRIESDTQFCERVLQDAARLGVVATFEGERHRGGIGDDG